MRILHILHSTNIGGTERAVLNYIRHNDDPSVENIVLSFNGGDLDEFYKLESNYYKVTYSNKSIENFKEIYSLIKKQEIDITYAYGLRTSILARIASRLLKKVNIYGVRGLQKNSKGLIEILNKATMKYVNQIITNSASVKQHLIKNLKYSATKITTIHNGTFYPSIERELYYEGDEVLKLVCVANFHLIKGHSYLIEAISNLIHKGFKLEITLIGDGMCRQDLINQAEELEIQNNVIFQGVVSDVYPYLYQNHLFILPSLSEGLPNAVMEAMATGMPVICTDVGGSSELIENMQNGILIEPKNVEQVEEAITYYYSNPKQSKLFGERGKDKIKNNFSFEKLVGRNNRIFNELMNR